MGLIRKGTRQLLLGCGENCLTGLWRQETKFSGMVNVENICLETSGRSPVNSLERLQARNHWTATCKMSLLLFSATAVLDLQPLLQPVCRVQAVSHTSPLSLWFRVPNYN